MLSTKTQLFCKNNFALNSFSKEVDFSTREPIFFQIIASHFREKAHSQLTDINIYMKTALKYVPVVFRTKMNKRKVFINKISHYFGFITIQAIVASYISKFKIQY